MRDGRWKNLNTGNDTAVLTSEAYTQMPGILTADEIPISSPPAPEMTSNIELFHHLWVLQCESGTSMYNLNGLYQSEALEVNNKLP